MAQSKVLEFLQKTALNIISLQAVKIASEMTYTASGEGLNSTQSISPCRGGEYATNLIIANIDL